MADQTIPRRTPPAEPRPTFGRRVENSPYYPYLQTGQETVSLAGKTVRLAVRHPLEWWRPMVTEASLLLRRCLVPLAISQGIWLLGFGVILFGAIAASLGVADRQAAGVYVGFTREVCTWITMMIFAGVAGSALAADLGARKIREELDALSVLGVDQLRTLVVPRVIAMTISAVILGLLALLISIAVNYAFAPSLLHFSPGVFRETVRLNIASLDLYASIVKHTILGFFIGIVACQKGLSCKGGAEGVGRAVNQTVVTAFIGIWLFNSAFNIAFLTSFPQVTVLKG